MSAELLVVNYYNSTRHLVGHNRDRRNPHGLPLPHSYTHVLNKGGRGVASPLDALARPVRAEQPRAVYRA